MFSQNYVEFVYEYYHSLMLCLGIVFLIYQDTAGENGNDAIQVRHLFLLILEWDNFHDFSEAMRNMFSVH